MPPANSQLIAALLHAIAPEGTNPAVLNIPGEPRAKARPRFAGHAYSDNKQRGYEAALKWAMKAQCRRQFKGDIAIVCIFFRSSKRRVDVDNLFKLILDAANKVLWEDDYQVAACAAVIKLDRENPRTLIALCETTA